MGYHLYSYTGAYYFKNRDFDRAIAYCTEAIRLQPRFGPAGDAYYYRACAYLKKGDRAKAKLDFDEAERLGFRPQ